MEEARFVLGLELFIAWIVTACYGVYFLLKMLFIKIKKIGIF